MKELSGLRRGSDGVRLVFDWLNYSTIPHWLMNLSLNEKIKENGLKSTFSHYTVCQQIACMSVFFLLFTSYIAWCFRCRCLLSSEATAPVSDADTFTIDLILFYLAVVFLSPAFIRWWCEMLKRVSSSLFTKGFLDCLIKIWNILEVWLCFFAKAACKRNIYSFPEGILNTQQELQLESPLPVNISLQKWRACVRLSAI